MAGLADGGEIRHDGGAAAAVRDDMGAREGDGPADFFAGTATNAATEPIATFDLRAYSTPGLSVVDAAALVNWHVCLWVNHAGIHGERRPRRAR